MKLLKVKLLTSYKMLADPFEINFMTKTRVDKGSSNDELLELEHDFYYPIETIFIGKNSSGKTTTLQLIHEVFVFLRTGRFSNRSFKEKEIFGIEVVYYHEGNLYRYVGEFIKDTTRNNEFLIIQDERLGKNVLKASYKKDLSNAVFFSENEFEANVDGDTSNIVKFTSKKDFNYSIDNVGYSPILFDVFYSSLGGEIFNAIVHLFDDSVEEIAPHIENGSTNGFTFKRVGSDVPIVVKEDYLGANLSAGTLRGINLYGLSIAAFRSGGTIIVDEVEKSFNRNLIENLILMFKDKSINKMGASIIYSTHYSELLDNNSRCDNVNVVHRDGNVISIKNMHSDFNFRTDMTKSGYFNENAFDTLIDYDRLMALKDALR